MTAKIIAQPYFYKCGFCGGTLELVRIADIELGYIDKFSHPFDADPPCPSTGTIIDIPRIEYEVPAVRDEGYFGARGSLEKQE